MARGRPMSLTASATAARASTSSSPTVGTFPDSTSRAPSLKPRERLLIELLAAERANKEIQAELGWSRAWLTRQLTRLYRRAGVRGRVGLALWAERQGILRDFHISEKTC